MAMVQIRRDPFARATLMREPCGKGSTCKWCGQPAKYSYGWVSDTSKGYHIDWKPFCSVGCWRDYHGCF